MTIAIAPDSFKGCMTAAEAARCMERGLRRGLRGACFRRVPMADGGEGTVDAVVSGTKGRYRSCRVRDPLGRVRRARFGLTGDGKTAVIEMAEASGLVLLAPAERNPLRTTTAGTGDLIRAALGCGVTRILVGIGGSATTDGGAGMATALGARLLDARGRAIGEGGGALGRLHRVDVSGLDARLRGVRIEVACDVDNPLAGPQGAACVYGPQKGATPAMVRVLDANLRHLAEVLKRDAGVSILRLPGAGAAGGLGGGLVGFLGARLRSGVEMVMEAVGLETQLRGCDLVVTGEGRMDGQTARGKTPAGVARAARRLGIPVIAICGCLGDGVEAVRRVGIDAYVAALSRPTAEADLPLVGPGRLEEAAEQVGRLLALGQGMRTR